MRFNWCTQTIWRRRKRFFLRISSRIRSDFFCILGNITPILVKLPVIHGLLLLHLNYTWIFYSVKKDINLSGFFKVARIRVVWGCIILRRLLHLEGSNSFYFTYLLFGGRWATHCLVGTISFYIFLRTSLIPSFFHFFCSFFLLF